MKVIEIDYENKTFKTEEGDEYPLMFGIDENVTLEDFQQILDDSANIIEKLT